MTPARPETTPQPNPGKVARLRRLWAEARPLAAGDAAAAYLQARGLDLRGLAADALRTHHALPYWTDGAVVGTYPAVLARVVGPTGDPVAMHATYLDPERPGNKAPVPAPRKLWPTHPGATRGAAVRLYPLDGDRLAVAEGIETALAVHQLAGLPCWAAISAGGLERVELPSAAREVFVCADHDENGAGQRAAEHLARRLVAEGRVVRVALPLEPGTDFLNALQTERREVAV
ncbi:MAG: toprim domain-containing protein [Deferrisomatales bacterium]|nr:toprim domain-containing protein [Deferrisomatales bacterium]